jgi:hypothetical protein
MIDFFDLYKDKKFTVYFKKMLLKEKNDKTKKWVEYVPCHCEDEDALIESLKLTVENVEVFNFDFNVQPLINIHGNMGIVYVPVFYFKYTSKFPCKDISFIPFLNFYKKIDQSLYKKYKNLINL